MQIDDVTKQLQKVASLPWSKILVVLAVSFVLAYTVSIFSARFLLQQKESIKIVKKRAKDQAPPMLVDKVRSGSANSLSNTDLKTIISRNVFNSEGKVGDADPDEGKPDGGQTPTDELIETDLPVKVVGIIYGGTPFTGLATIENTSKRRVNSFVVGDVVLDNAKLIEIWRDRIIVERGGSKEYALLQEFKLTRSKRGAKKAPAKGSNPIVAAIAKGPPPKAYKEEGFEREGTTMRMTAEYKKRIIGDEMTKTLQDAKAEPNIDPETGQLRGFKLTRIREGSIYLKAGLQNNDIVEEINGTALNNTAGAINLLNSLKGESEIEVRINRAGQTMTFTLSVN